MEREPGQGCERTGANPCGAVIGELQRFLEKNLGVIQPSGAHRVRREIAQQPPGRVQMRARRREGDRLTHTACRAQDRPCVMVETGETDECRGCDGVLSGATSEFLCDTEQPSGFVPFAGERGTVATFSGDPSRCTRRGRRAPRCRGSPRRRRCGRA